MGLERLVIASLVSSFVSHFVVTTLCAASGCFCNRNRNHIRDQHIRHPLRGRLSFDVHFRMLTCLFVYLFLLPPGQVKLATS